MHVLLLTGHSTGGIGAHVNSLARGLRRAGWRVAVATSARSARRFDFGESLHAVWPTASPRTWLASGRAIRRLMSEHDVVHAHGHQAGLVAVVLLATMPRRRRPAVAVSWHNAVLATGLRGGAAALVERFVARRADLLTGASADLVARARALGARGAELAPVASAITPWPGDRGRARAELATVVGDRVPGLAEPGQRVVLAVSRIAPQKRLDVLVDAAAAARPGHPNLTWVVIGDGPPDLTRKLVERARARAAPVVLLGPRDDVGRWMAAADMLALPSAWEARSLVVQEAMAARLPVVTTAVGGLPELVGDGGILVPAGDPAALADAVARVLDDPGLAARLASAAAQRQSAQPDEDDVVTAWQERYRRLAG